MGTSWKTQSKIQTQRLSAQYHFKGYLAKGQVPWSELRITVPNTPWLH